MREADRRWIEALIEGHTETLRQKILAVEKATDSLSKISGEIITRGEFQSKVDIIETQLASLGNGLDDLRTWRANLTGRTIAIGLMGGIVIAALGAVIGHLLGG